MEKSGYSLNGLCCDDLIRVFNINGLDYFSKLAFGVDPVACYLKTFSVFFKRVIDLKRLALMIALLKNSAMCANRAICTINIWAIVS